MKRRTVTPRDCAQAAQSSVNHCKPQRGSPLMRHEVALPALLLLDHARLYQALSRERLRSLAGYDCLVHSWRCEARRYVRLVGSHRGSRG